MFTLSKLFWIVAQPLSLAFFAIVISFVATLLGWRRIGLVFSSLGAAVLFVTLFTTAGSFFLQVLEERFPRPQADPSSVSCLIVLGGAFETEVTTARGGIELNQSADRFVEALRLARAFPDAQILVSGGDGSLSGTYEGDAAASQRFFSTFGIPVERLVRETTSRTTFENVQNSKSLLESAGLDNCLLITSAFHMPRSVGLMRKAGIAVVPWPTDYRTSGEVRLGLDFTQPTLNAQQTATAVREWIGLASYFASGRTSALFPAP
ncbi:YdcF family protein [Rhizobium sp. CG5]|uniref:YdcF family protein n=1 Tax=Rhizobium sp. CG5 TaxID=2726076 RepID=UPI0020341333|nr:YdcF family protein [Rhizobium sp. CG5]MCM2473573.1 YdcF family protein [Rhizobium sp. CG5]